jgi:pyruvate/2-oxoglutarate dehydrogenase complex dihydrolipoamide dehydrogenase (E3) component
MKFLLNHRVVDGVNNKEKGVSINLSNDKGEKITVDCDVALISIGRHAFTGGL